MSFFLCNKSGDSHYLGINISIKFALEYFILACWECVLLGKKTCFRILNKSQARKLMRCILTIFIVYFYLRAMEVWIALVTGEIFHDTLRVGERLLAIAFIESTKLLLWRSRIFWYWLRCCISTKSVKISCWWAFCNFCIFIRYSAITFGKLYLEYFTLIVASLIISEIRNSSQRMLFLFSAGNARSLTRQEARYFCLTTLLYCFVNILIFLIFCLKMRCLQLNRLYSLRFKIACTNNAIRATFA